MFWLLYKYFKMSISFLEWVKDIHRNIAYYLSVTRWHKTVKWFLICICRIHIGNIFHTNFRINRTCHYKMKLVFNTVFSIKTCSKFSRDSKMSTFFYHQWMTRTPKWCKTWTKFVNIYIKNIRFYFQVFFVINIVWKFWVTATWSWPWLFKLVCNSLSVYS